jgi:hypothetical protein
MNNTVRKVDTGGIITAYASGADTAHGYSGDSGPAVDARLYYPVRLTFDASDNLYISDALNSVIRKVTPEGSIYKFAGDGTASYSGDDGPADAAQLNVTYGVAINTHGVFYIADRGNQIIRRIGPPVPNAVHNAPFVSNSCNVFPNPANNGIFNANIHSDIDANAVLTITNTLGQTIDTRTVQTNKATPVQLNAPSGIYFVTATTNHNSWTTRIVIQ